MSDNIERRIWVLGAPDPEMETIERILRECGETVAYAANERGERLVGAAAYWGESLVTDVGNHPCTSGVTDVYLVECELLTPDARFEPGEDICHPELSGRAVRRIDHHRPGDPGYGRPPSEFLAASSVGQVIAELARLGRLPPEQIVGGRLAWSRGPSLNGPGMYGPPAGVIRHMHRDDVGQIGACQSGWHVLEPDPAGVRAVAIPDDLVLTAAADHCLGAAYRGECPGVDPDALMRWRAESRARFQGRTVEEVLADVERAQAALRAAPELVLSEHICEWHLGRPGSGGDCVNAAGTAYSEDPCSAVVVRDMRQPVDQRPTRELPEAAARLGIGYVSGPLVGPDGRQKITCSGTADQVRAFLDHWAPAQGLVDAYGDPARGFAGAYLPTEAP